MAVTIHQIHAAIIRDFGIYLPINGGMGNSIDDPIIIEKKIPVFTDSFQEFQKSPVKVERLYLDCVFAGRGVRYKKNLQELLHHNGKTIDRLTYEIEITENGETISRLESYYFDITQFFE